MGTLERFGGAAVMTLALIVPCTFGQIELRFNGSTASPLYLQPGDVVVFQVSGPPDAPFAALITPEPAFVSTPHGILHGNPLHQDAAIVYDGFDQSHPAYGFSRVPIANGVFQQSFIPFSAGGTYPPGGYVIQCLVGDPMSSGGLLLTNEIILIYDPPPPSITSVEPNHAPPGTQIFINGTDFEPVATNNVVRLNSVTCEVVVATQNQLYVTIPEGATSGNVVVETLAGTSNPAGGALASWLAIAPAGYLEELTAPPVITAPVAIVGDIVPGERRDFLLHVEPGEEVYAELYVYDPTISRISAQSNPLTIFFNPFLRIQRNPGQAYTVLTDDDSGPTVSAAIGLAKGSPRYVAIESEDVVVQVDSMASQSGGPFLLVVGTRPAVNLPVSVQGVTPSDARVGDLVTITGTGFDADNPALHTILMHGATASASAVTIASVSFVVPAGARSGPLQVSAPGGTSPWDSDRHQSWICIHDYTEIYEVEGTTPTVPIGAIVRGAVFPNTDADEYFVEVAGGQQIAIECHAWDPGSGNITAGYLLTPTPVDPDLRVLPPTGAGPILTFDQNSGPGLNATIGVLPGNPVFTAPFTGTFRIRVSSFFGWSSGSYVLAVNPIP